MKKLVRNPEVVWRVESHREAHVREVLGDPERVDEDTEAVEVGTVTILTGGVMHQLNLLGGEIWKLSDGSLDRDELMEELLEMFDVDRGTLKRDAYGFIDEMIQKDLLHEK